MNKIYLITKCGTGSEVFWWTFFTSEMEARRFAVGLGLKAREFVITPIVKQQGGANAGQQLFN